MFTHGTRYGYRVKNCRCDDCRAWNAAEARYQRSKHGKALSAITIQRFDAVTGRIVRQMV